MNRFLDKVEFVFKIGKTPDSCVLNRFLDKVEFTEERKKGSSSCVLNRFLDKVECIIRINLVWHVVY